MENIQTSDNKNIRKIYSKNQIDIATFFGGPLIGGYLISENYKTFGEKNAAKKTLLITIISTVLFLTLIIFLPEINIGDQASTGLSIIPLIIIVLFVRKYQGGKIQEYINKGFRGASSWGVFRKAIISLIITIIIVYLIVSVKQDYDVKYNYQGYLENYCATTYRENSIKNNKEYIPEDASCFVFNRLRLKGYTLGQVDQVLTLEYEYQKESGLVDNKKQNNTISYEPLPYIKKHQKTGLAEIQINEILTNEDGYLKAIGVTN